MKEEIGIGIIIFIGFLLPFMLIGAAIALSISCWFFYDINLRYLSIIFFVGGLCLGVGSCLGVLFVVEVSQ